MTWLPEATADRTKGQYVPANGIDIHYVEAGAGEPLLRLNNGMVSCNPVWASHSSAYASYMDTLAEHFRVIAPDTRGSGRTVHSGGPITYTLLADDVWALIAALDLDRPLLRAPAPRFNRPSRISTIFRLVARLRRAVDPR